MKKLKIVLQFKTPCLGHIPTGDKGDYFALPRDVDGRVVIMQSWFRAALRKAAEHIDAKETEKKAAATRLFQSILLETTGVPCTEVLTREMPHGRHVTYDVLPIGSKLELYFLVPFGIPGELVLDSLNRVGRWIGLSPRHAGEGYGRYEILTSTWEDEVNAGK